MACDGTVITIKKEIRYHEIGNLRQTNIEICIDKEIGETRQQPQPIYT